MCVKGKGVFLRVITKIPGPRRIRRDQKKFNRIHDHNARNTRTSDTGFVIFTSL
jgi:hypothetical protein